MKPLIVAIAGPSGAGKTALTHEVARLLGGRCSRLPLDSYYQPLPHLPLEERALRNYDHPSALDWPLVEMHLAALAAGEPVEVPVYLFDQHTRADETHSLASAEVVIVEGILALHHEAIRARAALKAYVTAEESECLKRRMERDTVERGRSSESVLAQYYATVQPMAIEYVEPSRQYADVVVSGQARLAETAVEILRRIALLRGV